jgi:hypothetical protein
MLCISILHFDFLILNLSFYSIDVDKHYGHYFDLDDNENDEFDYKKIILQLFEKQGKKETEDYDDHEGIFFLDKDFDKEYTIGYEFNHGHEDELFKEYYIA